MAGRRLGASTYSAAKMKILPSQADADKFPTHPNNQARERGLYRFTSLRHEDISGVSDFLIRELENKQTNIKEEEMVDSVQRLEESNEMKSREDKDAFRQTKEEKTKEFGVRGNYASRGRREIKRVGRHIYYTIWSCC